MAPALPLLLALVSSSPAAPVTPGSDTAIVVVVDGGARREIHRTTRGRDGVPARVLYVDPASGRSASATVEGAAIVRIAATRDIAEVASRHRLVIRRPLMATIGLWLVGGGPGEDGVDVAARLAGVDGVLEAFPDLAFAHRVLDVAPPFSPNDPRYPAQFFLEEMQMEGAWAFTRGSPDVTVAVVDNGCDLTHLDLADKFDPGHDVLTDDEDPSFVPNGTGNEHGTACAGLVAAITDNDRDVAGACPLCRLSCTRMLGADSEPVPLNADVRAFAHALEDDVDVVSNSWGFVEAIPVPQVLKDAIIEVQQNGRGGRGAVVVFASGNDSREIGDDELLAVPGVLGVGATNNLGELTQFSNRGRSVDVTAPTGTVTTDISGPDGGADGDVTFTFGGTSSACPLVAGLAGLILSAKPELTADEVNAIIEGTAEQSAFARPDEDGHDLEYGFGLVRADLARVAGPLDGGDDALTGGGCQCDDGSAPVGTAAALPVAIPWLWWRRRRRG